MVSVFSLEREYFHNDIDHATYVNVIGLFVDEKLAKRYAQEIYEKESAGGTFDILQWVEGHSDSLPERHWIETNLIFDEYKVTDGNFRIEEIIVHGY